MKSHHKPLFLSSKGLSLLLLLAATAAILQGCSGENPKTGVPVQPGDYAHAPGEGASKGAPGGGPMANPNKNPNK